jgi:hypothetical protein
VDEVERSEKDWKLRLLDNGTGMVCKKEAKSSVYLAFAREIHIRMCTKKEVRWHLLMGTN